MKVLRCCTVAESIEFVRDLLPELVEEGYEVGVVTSPGEHWADIDHLGDSVSKHRVPMERHIAPFKDLKSLWRLIRLFSKERPTMVHSMTPKAGLLCMIAAWLTRVPVRVHTFTGLVFPTATGITKRILMATDWLTCACATHIIPEGEGVKNDLLNHHITRKPIRVLGHGSCKGIDLEHFSRKAVGEWKIENGELKMVSAEDGHKAKALFTFVFVGRLVGDKGINELVEAFTKLHGENTNTQLILVGYKEQDLDPLKPETLAAIDSCPSINAVGPQTDVRPWLAASDAFVFPSYREGFPNVVLEAGAMSLPSIVTDINGSREIITDGLNGTIIPPRDTEALYRAMRSWVNDPSVPTGMAAKARPHVAERYDHRYVRQCLKDFYKEILKNV